MLLPLLLACGPRAADTATDTGSAGSPAPGCVALDDDGWRRGDLHAHTTYSSDGFDSVAGLLNLVRYTRDPTFLAAHPEHEGHPLDFIAITDHGTFDAQADPDAAADDLVVIPGVEWNFSVEEANLLGLAAGFDDDPTGGGITNEDMAASVEQVHAAGALFSINHPLVDAYPFPWDVRTHDSVEIWNTAWALSAPPVSDASVDAWEAEHVERSPLFDRALAERAHHANGAALALWEAMLARGVHSTPVGGSDHHVLFLPGLVTTWVRVEQGGVDGIIDGIRARRTFVSRSAAGPEAVLSVEVDGQQGEAGADLPLAAPATAVVRLGTARAPDGVARLVRGSAVATDEALADSPLGEVVWEQALSQHGEAEAWEVSLEVAPGDWLYALVDEPLVPAGAADPDFVEELAAAAAVAGTEVFDLAPILGDLLDTYAFSDPSRCDPADWDPLALQCLPVDQDTPGSMFVPDAVGRALHALTVDGAPTGWTRGAITSAVLF